MTTGLLPDDHIVVTHEDLCRALGAEVDSFTGDLLSLIGRADPGNRALLRSAFPFTVAAWELWSSLSGGLPAAELAELASDVAKVAPVRVVTIDVDRDKL